MSTTILAQTTASIQAQSNQVYEYALTVVNPIDKDTQTLIAAFSSLPSLKDWQHWLSGWNSNTSRLSIRQS